jgi:methionyl-tRNA synthetase
MVNKYFLRSSSKKPGEMLEIDRTYRSRTEAIVAQVETNIEDLAFQQGTSERSGRSSPQAINTLTKPPPGLWPKTPRSKERLATIMYSLLESQRIVYFLLSAFMPKTSARALGYLGWEKAPSENGFAWGALKEGTRIIKSEALFPRIDEKTD